jgi:(R,R)-butanediol dehydrogenase / meso-butanediol dehydrogenase / diacetyl reductase
MKAARWYKKEDIRIENIPEPQPGSGQVKVQVRTCGICGSDIHEYKNGPFLIPTRPHPLTNRSGGPVILGHEFSATVVENGAGAQRFKAGERVTVNPLIYCGKCHYCRLGQHIMCTQLGTAGFAWDGAFAEFGVFPEYGLHHLPDSVSDEAGAFTEPLAVAIHAVKRSRLKIGASVAIIGAGPIGLLVLQACLAAGAGKAYIVEPLAARRELALKTGAAAAFDPAKTEVGKEIGALTEGLRAEWVFDCVGNQSSFDLAVKVTGRRGVICIVGLALRPIEVPFLKLWGHEKELIFSAGYEDEFPTAISYLSDRRVKIDNLVSARIKLKDLVSKGIKELMDHADRNVKILVYPK